MMINDDGHDDDDITRIYTNYF